MGGVIASDDKTISFDHRLGIVRINRDEIHQREMMILRDTQRKKTLAVVEQLISSCDFPAEDQDQAKSVIADIQKLRR